MKNINHTRSSISDDIRNILCSSANMRRAIPLILRLLMNKVNLSTNLASHFFDLVIGKILTSRLSLSKHLAHNLGNLLLLGKIGVFHNRRNASSRLLLLISKHLILCIYLVFRSEERFSRNAETDLVCRLLLEKKNGRGGAYMHDALERKYSRAGASWVWFGVFPQATHSVDPYNGIVRR